MHVSRSYLALLAAVTLWCLLILAPPLTALTGHASLISVVAAKVGATVCHQLETHSLHLGGATYAVCARCTGVYTGFALATLAVAFVRVPWRRRERLAWAVAMTPMLFDVVLDTAGVHSATLASRVLTGGLFGAVAALLLVPYILEGFRELRSRFVFPTLRTHHELHT